MNGAPSKAHSVASKTVSELPDLEVRLNGRVLPKEARRDLRSAAVQEDLDAASMFTLVLHNWDEDRQRFIWSDGDLFAPGTEVELRFGYLDRLERVMLGEITGLEPAFGGGQPPTLLVRGYDHRHRLMRGRSTHSFVDMKDSEIARQVADRAGLGVKVTDSDIKLAYVLQHNQTDLEFLQVRARRIGYQVFVRDKVLYFQPPDLIRGAVRSLSLGPEIIEFHPRLTTMSQVERVQAQGWDVQQKVPLEATAGVGREVSRMEGKITGPKASRAFGSQHAVISNQPIMDKAAAGQMAFRQFNLIALNYIHAEGLCYGQAGLHAGEMINIQGAGENFSGDYYLTSVSHAVTSQNGYLTRFQAKRNAI
jgi:phage protein D